MDAIVVIFLFIASIVAICTIIYVIIDALLDRKPKEEEKKVEPEPEFKPAPEPVIIPVVIPEPEPVIIPVLEQVDAEEADVLLSDEEAEKRVIRERGAGHGKKGEINLGIIDMHFEAGETITLADLKRKKLVSQKEKRIKILADGILTKNFVIKAEAFSKEAIKMIELMGGTVVELID